MLSGNDRLSLTGPIKSLFAPRCKSGLRSLVSVLGLVFQSKKTECKKQCIINTSPAITNNMLQLRCTSKVTNQKEHKTANLATHDPVSQHQHQHCAHSLVRVKPCFHYLSRSLFLAVLGKFKLCPSHPVLRCNIPKKP